jgi:hypothetical protein
VTKTNNFAATNDSHDSEVARSNWKTRAAMEADERRAIKQKSREFAEAGAKIYSKA